MAKKIDLEWAPISKIIGKLVRVDHHYCINET